MCAANRTDYGCHHQALAGIYDRFIRDVYQAITASTNTNSTNDSYPDKSAFSQSETLRVGLACPSG